MQMQNRGQLGPMPNVAGLANFSATNAMIGNNQHMLPYTQHYFGNQAIATPGFIANNFPAQATAMNAVTMGATVEPIGRRKSIIENINPFISEQKVLSSDLLSAFPVSCLWNISQSTSFFEFGNFYYETFGNCNILGRFAACSFNQVISGRSNCIAKRN